MPAFSCFLVILVTSPLMAFKKWKYQKSLSPAPVAIGSWMTPNPAQPQIQFNTSSNNDSLVNVFEATLIFAVFSFLGFPFFALVILGINIRDVFVYLFFSGYCVLTVLLPVLYFARRPSRLRTVREFFHT